MKKIKIKGIWLTILIIIIAIVALWMVKASIMSSYLSHKLKVHVSVASITMRPSFTKIYRFHITNPIHSRTRTAFLAKKIRIEYDFRKLFSTPSVIDLIELEDLFLGIEFYNPLGTQNNWTEITSKMNQKKKSAGEVIIKKLVIQNLTVKIQGMGLKGLIGKAETKHVDRLEFHNINSKEGFPTDQLIRAIFGSTGLQKYIKDIFSPQGIFKDIFSPFKGLGKNDPEHTDLDLEPQENIQDKAEEKKASHI